MHSIAAFNCRLATARSSAHHGEHTVSKEVALHSTTVERAGKESTFAKHTLWGYFAVGISGARGPDKRGGHLDLTSNKRHDHDYPTKGVACVSGYPRLSSAKQRANKDPVTGGRVAAGGSLAATQLLEHLVHPLPPFEAPL